MHRSPRTPARTAPAVLVVGAGPTGLTLACQLAVRGVTVRVVEAAAEPQRGSRGKGIQPRTLEVFEDLGIVDDVLSHGRLGMPMQVAGPAGTKLVGTEVPAPRSDMPFRTSLVTPEWRIEAALRTLLTELGGEVEFGSALTGFDQSPDAVSATIVHSDGAAETVSVEWLVGCDGGHSTVRKQSGISFDGDTLDDVRMIVADVEVAGLDRDSWHMWRHPEGMVNLCPLPSTNVFQYQASVAEGQDPSLGLTNLQAVLDRRSGRDDIVLGEPEWSTLWRANVRLADRYRQGRVLLAGDAAHIHSPAGGQGMNTGIQDAYNLGWKLAAVIGGAPSTLIDTYDAERRPIAAGVLALSNERLRQTITDHAIPTGRDSTTMQLDVGYRGSVIARDDRTPAHGVRAGDRAPDATDLELGTTPGRRHRLFDLLRGSHFTVLSFGAAPTFDADGLDVRAFRVVAEPATAGEIADLAGHLTRSYEASEATLVLIRPDGYIGLVCDDGDQAAVTDYLAAVTPASTSTA